MFYSTRKTLKLEQIGALNWGPFGILQLFSRKTSKKLKEDPLKSLKFCQKSLTTRKKLKGGPFGIFQHFCRKISKKNKGTLWNFSTFLSQNIKKNEGGPFEVKKISRKKSHIAEKAERGTI